jgi:SAM-dependent methyltransferase
MIWYYILIYGGLMYEELLKSLSARPAVYEPGDSKFWDDEHISKRMLATHLDPDDDLATRKPGFVKKSADWIASTAKGKRLLDLGCGPGIYAELFAERGFSVKGLDLSPRSITYAKRKAEEKALGIEYVCGNYLEAAFGGPYDIVTLIYCDFGVLSAENRKSLLKMVREALAPGGVFVFDALTPAHYGSREECTNWSYCDGGFWSEKPYACLYSFLRYDECRTYCDRYVIIEEEGIRRFNIWNHAFTGRELLHDLKSAGFARVDIYGDIAGGRYSEESKTICAAAYVQV